MRFLKDQSIRRQVLTATFVLLVPFTVAAFWSANRTRIEREEEVQAESGSIAAAAATHLNQYLNGLDSVAAALVRDPAVKVLDRAQCDRLFAGVLEHQPLLLNVGLTDIAGRLRGSGLPTTDSTITMGYPSEVVKYGKPIVSELMTGQVTRKSTVVLAYPVRNDDGALVGVLGLGVNLAQLQTLFNVIPLPEGSVVTMTDQRSRVLARSREPDRFIGSVITQESVLPRDVKRVQKLTGLDGVQRFYGNAVVDRGPWLLSVGIPSRVAVERAMPLWRRNFAIGIGGIASVLLLSLILSSAMSRGVNQVRHAVQRIAHGDLSPPVRTPATNLELAQLQDAFITMAANLREVHDTLDRQVEQERKMRETLQSLQRQVVRQERLAAVGVLVSGVAHELNNPLQAILGTAELLERREELTPEALDEVSFLKTQSGRAREIIRNLSRFSSQQPGPPSLIDMHDVVAEVIQLRQRDLDALSISLELQASTTRKVYANFTEIEQVALNFVINAQQAIEASARSKGRILIRVFDTGKKVCVEVHDDGPGVAPEVEAKLFQPFFTTKPVGKGTGLGLSVSYGIIESYGGTIGYRGNAWGGATFFFELPAGDSAARLRADAGESSGTNDPPSLLHRSVSSGV